MSWVIVEEFHNSVLGTLSEQDIFDKLGPSFEALLDFKTRKEPYKYVLRLASLKALNRNNGGLCQLHLQCTVFEIKAIHTELHTTLSIDYPGYRAPEVFKYYEANVGRNRFEEITGLNCNLDFMPDHRFGIQGFFNI